MRFVLLDALDSLEPGKRVRARKRFDPADELFLDHFPGFALVPGSLLLECMAQAGGWLVAHATGFASKTVLAMVERAQFRAPARPGDELSIDAELELLQGRSAATLATVSAQGRLIASARLVYGLHDLHGDGPFAGPETRQYVESTFARLGGPAAVLRGGG